MQERRRQADDIGGVPADVDVGGDGQRGGENVELEGRHGGGR